jgi:hypothetical protein
MLEILPESVHHDVSAGRAHRDHALHVQYHRPTKVNIFHSKT